MFIKDIIFNSIENYVTVVLLAYLVAGLVWKLSGNLANLLIRRVVRVSIIFWTFPIVIPAGHGFMFSQPWLFILLLVVSGVLKASFAILGIWVIVLLVATHNVKA